MSDVRGTQSISTTLLAGVRCGDEDAWSRLDKIFRPIAEKNGRWLADYLRKNGQESAELDADRLPVELTGAAWAKAVAWIGARIADALAYAHRRNVVHRDVKPANVLLRADGSPKLLDFNVGFGQHVLGARPEDDFGGSFAYMAPEQRQVFMRKGAVADVDGCCDIYSLGVMLHELLTGELLATEHESTGMPDAHLDAEQSGVVVEDDACLCEVGRSTAERSLPAELLADCPSDQTASFQNWIRILRTDDKATSGDASAGKEEVIAIDGKARVARTTTKRIFARCFL